eukprot:8005082-Pyramimonas_sp.AAC.1
MSWTLCSKAPSFLAFAGANSEKRRLTSPASTSRQPRNCGLPRSWRHSSCRACQKPRRTAAPWCGGRAHTARRRKPPLPIRGICIQIARSSPT